MKHKVSIMKYRFLLLALLCMGFVCNAQNRIDSQGRRQGHWIKTDKDGSRIFEGDFQDGKEIGTFNYYYPDGTLKIRNTFIIPGRYCRHEAFNAKGKLLATGYYDQKNRDSVWNYYNEEGQLIKIASYRMGIKHGNHVIFKANGDTAEVSGWADNHRHGRWWKRIGEKGYITGHYEKGLMQGVLVEYDSDGRLARKGNYNGGLRDGKQLYYERGNLTVEEIWDKDIMIDRKILLHCPNARMQSIHSIAYIIPKGTGNTLVYLNDGTKLSCDESLETLNERVGHDTFVIIDRKARILANTGSIIGFDKDSDGRIILDLSPKPPFTIFPDEECIKMVRSLKRLDQLD
ncbi:MAG: hypothetical protein J6X58_06765 [Bacteroidales bacterium]|nr:hypothetical protein [Bacteroidales bacterium]